MSEIVLQKLDELIALAQVERESNVLIVTTALRGSIESGDDGLLATKVQEFTKDVLLPRSREKRNSERASMN